MSLISRIRIPKISHHLQKGRYYALSSNTNFNNVHPPTSTSSRSMSGFSFAGPRKLEEIIKTELLKDKSKEDVKTIWNAYHEDKEGVCGYTLDGTVGSQILERAEKWPFFIQPIFRESGFFMLISQYQPPSHFLLAYLEDYKMDPARAQPLVTFSIFTDLESTHDLSLLRCDVVNKGIEVEEGGVVMRNLLDSYRIEEEFSRVRGFNDEPEGFDVDDFISCMNQKWSENKGDGVGVDVGVDVKKES